MRATCAKAYDDVMPTRRRHFGNVRKLPSGRWQASYWHQGLRHVAADTFPAKSDALAFLMAAWCGLRFGELAALRRDRIDLLHGKVRVAEMVTELASGERFAGPPKTSAGRRTVAIPPNVVPVLEEHMATVGPGPDALLFPAPQGGY